MRRSLNHAGGRPLNVFNLWLAYWWLWVLDSASWVDLKFWTPLLLPNWPQVGFLVLWTTDLPFCFGKGPSILDISQKYKSASPTLVLWSHYVTCFRMHIDKMVLMMLLILSSPYHTEKLRNALKRSCSLQIWPKWELEPVVAAVCRLVTWIYYWLFLEWLFLSFLFFPYLFLMDHPCLLLYLIYDTFPQVPCRLLHKFVSVNFLYENSVLSYQKVALHIL